MSEKPIAEDLKAAKDLIEYYYSCKAGVTWGIAENIRYRKSFRYARTIIEGLGRILSFEVKEHMHIKPGWKYYGE